MNSLGSLESIMNNLKQSQSPQQKWVRKGDVEQQRAAQYQTEQAKLDQQKKVKEQQKVEEIQKAEQHRQELLQALVVKQQNQQAENGLSDSNAGQVQTPEEQKEKESSFSKAITPVCEIGDRKIEDLIEKCERNNKQYLNVKKFEDGCKRHSIEEKSGLVLVWCKKIMGIWHKNIQEMGEIYKETAQGKAEMAKYTSGYVQIKPLFKLLKKRKVADDIMNSLYLIVQYCMMKEFIRAHDKYVELAIGNSPWPMGVTMVGIHERSGRSRINTNQIVHVLNDETTRKYLQSVKRLLTVCEKEYGVLSTTTA